MTLDESVRAKERELSLRSLERLADADARLSADVTSILGMSEYERRRFHNAELAKQRHRGRLRKNLLVWCVAVPLAAALLYLLMVGGMSL
jgi:hypothetical protein